MDGNDEVHSDAEEEEEEDGTSDGGDCDEEDEESIQSEYSFYQSSDDECDVVDADEAAAVAKPSSSSTPAPTTTASASFPPPAAIAKRNNDPLAELDRILDECNVAFPDSVGSTGGKGRGEGADSTTLDGVFHAATGTTASRKSPLGAMRKAMSGKTKSSATATTTAATSASIKAKAATSTLKAGVGYETGKYSAEETASAIATNMSNAAKKQRELDALCILLLNRLADFVRGYEGSEGMVLLALKMSPGFNRLLFSLLKNDSLQEWTSGARRGVYEATMDLIDVFSSSQFYVGILLHNLLEGEATVYDGTSNCHALLEIVSAKAALMNRSLARTAKTSDDKPIIEEGPTTAACRRIVATYDAADVAVRRGREKGLIVDPEKELTSRHMNAGQPHLDVGVGGGSRARPTTEREDIATYKARMKRHRLRHVSLVDSARTHYAFYGEATRNEGAMRPKRTLRIASEIAGLSSDLPVEWSSGIYVLCDEDRPDVLRACIAAPENTPYENGCFEFDIFLPSTYPEAPPKVKLCTTSGGAVRFNPNLYNCGKVCLSLLGTWSGPGWIPETSTLLQVLVSIQSQILVSDPYFNEPGCDAQVESQQKLSKEYDRQIRAATLKVAVLQQMKKPSALFAECMREHFLLKKRRILSQLDEWLEMETKAESENKAGTLVAGGGIKSSVKIVKGFCDQIRTYYEELDGKNDVNNKNGIKELSV